MGCGTGAAAPQPTENQFISDITLSGNALANYSVFAPGIARSRFERVTFNNALSVGASIGYGWCNYFEFCRFGDNGVGIHTCEMPSSLYKSIGQCRAISAHQRRRSVVAP